MNYIVSISKESLMIDFIVKKKQLAFSIIIKLHQKSIMLYMYMMIALLGYNVTNMMMLFL